MIDEVARIVPGEIPGDVLHLFVARGEGRDDGDVGRRGVVFDLRVAPVARRIGNLGRLVDVGDRDGHRVLPDVPGRGGVSRLHDDVVHVVGRRAAVDGHLVVGPGGKGQDAGVAVDGEVARVVAAEAPGDGFAFFVARVVVGHGEVRGRGVVLDLRERRGGVGWAGGRDLRRLIDVADPHGPRVKVPTLLLSFRRSSAVMTTL